MAIPPGSEGVASVTGARTENLPIVQPVQPGATSGGGVAVVAQPVVTIAEPDGTMGDVISARVLLLLQSILNELKAIRILHSQQSGGWSGGSAASEQE